MNEGQATFWMILLFAMRCVVPILLTIAVGYLMNRLVAKWEAEEAAQADSGVETGLWEQPTGKRPSLGWCWEFRRCEQSNCPAYQVTNQMCWQVKMDGNGRLAPTCQQCDYYVQRALA